MTDKVLHLYRTDIISLPLRSFSVKRASVASRIPPQISGQARKCLMSVCLQPQFRSCKSAIAFFQQYATSSPQLFTEILLCNCISAYSWKQVFQQSAFFSEEMLLHKYVSKFPISSAEVQTKQVAELRLQTFKIKLPHFAVLSQTRIQICWDPNLKKRNFGSQRILIWIFSWELRKCWSPIWNLQIRNFFSSHFGNRFTCLWYCGCGLKLHMPTLVITTVCTWRHFVTSWQKLSTV